MKKTMILAVLGLLVMVSLADAAEVSSWVRVQRYGETSAGVPNSKNGDYGADWDMTAGAVDTTQVVPWDPAMWVDADGDLGCALLYAIYLEGAVDSLQTCVDYALDDGKFKEGTLAYTGVTTGKWTFVEVKGAELCSEGVRFRISDVDVGTPINVRVKLFSPRRISNVAD